MTKTKFLALIASVVLVLTMVTAAFAQGVSPPNKFGGMVMIGDDVAPDGTMIVAMIGEDKVAEDMVMGGNYSLQIEQGDEPLEGMMVTFMVGDMDADETVTWMAFQAPMKQDLHVMMAMEPEPTAMPMEPGPRGPRGLKGDQGDPGADGMDGADGRDGIHGRPGTKGDDGADGSDGADGRNGSDGNDGADGADGNDGAKGSNGSNGADGAKGDTGAVGGVGPAGAPGAAGADGASGGGVLAIIALIVAIVAIVAAGGIYLQLRRA